MWVTSTKLRISRGSEDLSRHWSESENAWGQRGKISTELIFDLQDSGPELLNKVETLVQGVCDKLGLVSRQGQQSHISISMVFSIKITKDKKGIWGFLWAHLSGNYDTVNTHGHFTPEHARYSRDIKDIADRGQKIITHALMHVFKRRRWHLVFDRLRRRHFQ